MADAKMDRVHAIMYKLQRSAVLADDEMKDLQATIDILEKRGVARESHHETTSHHHTSALLDVPGVLERNPA